MSFCVYNLNKIINYIILVRMMWKPNDGYVNNFQLYCTKNDKLENTRLMFQNKHSNFCSVLTSDVCGN